MNSIKNFPSRPWSLLQFPRAEDHSLGVRLSPPKSLTLARVATEEATSSDLRLLRYSGSIKEPQRSRTVAGRSSASFNTHRRCRSDVHVDEAMLIARLEAVWGRTKNRSTVLKHPISSTFYKDFFFRHIFVTKEQSFLSHVTFIISNNLLKVLSYLVFTICENVPCAKENIFKKTLNMISFFFCVIFVFTPCINHILSN